jgi:hypothetical protein
MVYLLKAKTKETLLGNDPYTRSSETGHVRCDITQQ